MPKVSKKQPLRIAVLVSGGGTNLQALIDAKKNGEIIDGDIVLVISNRADAYALKRAESAGIKSVIIEKKSCRNQGDFESKILRELTANYVDLIVLAGFMTVLSANFVSQYPDRIINIHPSLIPAHCGNGFYGLKVHEDVLKCGDKITGATVHFVNEVTDGGKIIAQKQVDVEADDTPQILQKRVMEEAEWIILPRAVQEVCSALRQTKSPSKS